MDKKELSRIYFLRKEIAKQKRRIIELEGSFGRFHMWSEIPRQTCVFTDKTGKIASELMDLKVRLEKNLKKKIQAEQEISDFIENIDDSLVRLILTHRCVNCYSWAKIAQKIGGNNTADGLRKIFSRYTRNLH